MEIGEYLAEIEVELLKDTEEGDNEKAGECEVTFSFNQAIQPGRNREYEKWQDWQEVSRAEAEAPWPITSAGDEYDSKDDRPDQSE